MNMRGEESMYCRKCGTLNADNANFCINCGEKLRKETLNDSEKNGRNNRTVEWGNISVENYTSTSLEQTQSIKKIMIGLTLILTICFFALGACYKKASSVNEGISMSTGLLIDGEIVGMEYSGQIGGDSEKAELFDVGGSMFYTLSAISGCICGAFVLSLVLSKK